MAARYPNDGPPESNQEILPHGWMMRRDPRTGRNYYQNTATGEATWDKNDMWRRSGARPQQQLPGMPDNSQMPTSSPQRSRMQYTQQIATNDQRSRGMQYNPQMGSSQHQLAPPQNNIITRRDQSHLPRRNPNTCGSTDELPGIVVENAYDWMLRAPPSYPRTTPEPNYQDSTVLNRREEELSQHQGQFYDHHRRNRIPWPDSGFRAIDVEGEGYCSFNAMFGSLYLLGLSRGFNNGRDVLSGLIAYMRDDYAKKYLQTACLSMPYRTWLYEAENGGGTGPEIFAVLAEWLEVRTIVYTYNREGYEGSLTFVPRSGRHSCTIHIGYIKSMDKRGRFHGHYLILIPNANNDLAARQVGGMRSSSPRPAQSSTSTHSQGSAVSQESLDNLTSMGFPKDLSATALQKAGGNEERAIDYLIDPTQDLAASASNSLVDVSAEDIQLITMQTGATYAEAKNALQDANGDLGEALVELVKIRSRSGTQDSGLGQSGEHGQK